MQVPHSFIVCFIENLFYIIDSVRSVLGQDMNYLKPN